MSNCRISYNSTLGSGGAIYFGMGLPTVTNCLIEKNSAVREGGGIVSYWSAMPTISNCTIVDNQVHDTLLYDPHAYRRGRGGGLACFYESNTVLIDTIVWGNTAMEGSQIALGGVIDPNASPRPAQLAVSYCDVQGWEDPNGSGCAIDSAAVLVEPGSILDWGCETILAADPCFVLPKYYLSHVDANQSVDSPCIDRGSTDADALGLGDYTTRTDLVPDDGIVDIGYHYSTVLFQLTVEVKDGHGTAEPNSGWYNQYEVLTLTSHPEQGYRVKGWYDKHGILVSIDDTLQVLVNSDLYFTVEFELERTVIVPQDFESIQAALTDTQPDGTYTVRSGDSIVLEPQAYREHSLDFDGRSISISSEKPDDPCFVAATIIDCQGQGSAFIFRGGEKAPYAVIDGLTIINGDAMDSASRPPAGFPGAAGENAYGGAIVSFGPSSPIISNCIIRDCKARGQFGANGADGQGNPIGVGFPGADAGAGGDGYGGALYFAAGSSPTIRKCSILNCRAIGGNGGAGGRGGDGVRGADTPIDTVGGGPGGSAAPGGNAYGGAMYFESECNVTIQNCLIAGCSSTQGAGNVGGDGGNGIASEWASEGAMGGDGGAGSANGAESKYGAMYFAPRCTINISDTSITDNRANTTLPDDVNEWPADWGEWPIADGTTKNQNEWRGGYGGVNAEAPETGEPAGEDGQAGSGSTLSFVGANYYNIGCDVNLVNCVLTSNASDTSGGGDAIGGSEYYESYCHVNITYCHFADNSSFSEGGAGQCYGAFCTVDLSDCNYLRNSAAGGDGGALYFGNSCTASVEDCNFVDNWSANDGGAVYLPYVLSLDINDSNFVGNNARGYYGSGGALYWDKADTVAVKNSQFSKNDAAFGGAIAWYGDELGQPSEANIAVLDCVITENAADHGGGLFWIQGAPLIKGCAIANNSAQGLWIDFDYGPQFGDHFYGGGGGVYCWSTNALIQDTLITDNAVSGSGGGVYLGGGTCWPILKNCLIARNTAVLEGGGIASYWFVRPTIQNCTIADNRAADQRDSSHGRGGGLSCSYESVTTLINSILAGNEATFSLPGETGTLGNQIAIGSDADPLDVQRPAELTVSYSLVENWGDTVQCVIDPCSVYVEPDRVLNWDCNTIDAVDPLFAPYMPERLGVRNYFLSHIDAGDSDNSVCIDAGSADAADPNMRLDDYTTRTDGVTDSDTVDLGVHYPLTERCLCVRIEGHEHGTIVLDPNDPAGPCNPTCQDGGRFLNYTIVGLTAIPDPGYTVKWNGTDNDGSPAFINTVTMYTNRTVTVTFQAIRTIVVPHQVDTIEEAVEDAASGDVIVVEPGTHYVASPDGVDFKGKKVTLRSRRPDDPNIVRATIIDCQSQGRAFIFQSNEDAHTIVDGFTIRNGYAEGPAGYHGRDNPRPRDPDDPTTYSGGNAVGNGYGGAIYFGQNTSPIIRRCIIENSEVVGPIAGDGDIADDYPDLPPEGDFNTPYNVTTYPGPVGGAGGSAIGHGCGGAIYCGPGSSPAIEECDFTANSAWGGRGGNGGTGGGGYRTGPTVLEQYVWYGSNTGGRGGYGGDANGTGRGGAIYCDEYSAPLVIRCRFNDNTVGGGLAGNGGDGGMGRDDHAEPAADLLNDGGDGGNGGNVFGVYKGNAIHAAHDVRLTLNQCTFNGNAVGMDPDRTGAGAGGAGGPAEDWPETDPDNGVEGPNGVSGNTIFLGGYGGAVYLDPNSAVAVDDSHFEENEALSSGGAFYFSNTRESAPRSTFVDIIFVDNVAQTGSGGAVYSDANFAADFNQCTFTRNVASTKGGAIDCNSFRHLAFADCVFGGNRADEPNVGRGGALFCRGRIDRDDDMTLLRTNFYANQADDIGGAMFFDECDANVIHCSIFNNMASSGGGIYLSNTYADDSVINIIGTNISRNFAASEYGDGGGLLALSTSVNLTNCEMTENISAAVGGAISFIGISRPQVKNCLFTDNFSQGAGGAIACFLKADPDILNCTFSENRSRSLNWPGREGGSIYYDPDMTSSVITNCIFHKSVGVAVYEISTSDVQFAHNLFVDNRDGDYRDGNDIHNFDTVPDANGNFSTDDPAFADGPLGEFYLSQIAAGQALDSPALDAGIGDIGDLGAYLTTRTDHVDDVNPVDIGYHYDVTPYWLTIETEGPGQVFACYDPCDAGTCSQSPDPSSFFYLRAEPDEGYRVKSWTGTENDPAWNTNQNTVRMRGNKTIKVEFEPDIHRVLEVPLGGYQSIAEAISDANNGDTIMIQSGTYPGTGFIVEKNITITSTNPDDPDVVASTVIDCNGDQGEHVGGFVLLGENDGTVVLAGLTIMNSDIATLDGDDAEDPDNRKGESPFPSIGGGIVISGDHVVVNCVIRDCIRRGGQAGASLPGQVSGQAGGDGGDGGLAAGAGIFIANGASVISNVLVENCHLIGGNATDGGDGAVYGDGGNGGYGGAALGAGICVASGEPLFSRVTVRGCTATGGNAGNGGNGQNDADGGHGGISGNAIGAGVFFSYGSTATFIDCTVENCRVIGGIAGNGGNGGDEEYARGGYGGLSTDNPDSFSEWTYNVVGAGVYCGEQTDAVFANCSFLNNVSESSIGGIGGLQYYGARQLPWETWRVPTFGAGVYCADYSKTEFVGCTFRDNLTSYYDGKFTGYGAGLCAYNVISALVTGSELTENSASIGGGIYAKGSDVSVTDCNLSDNESYVGGGLVCVDSLAEVARCVLRDNTASQTIRPTDANQADDSYPIQAPILGTGGGLYCFGSDALVSDSTFTGNTSSGSGGGVYLGGYDNPDFPTVSELKNCLIRHNKAGRDGGGVSCNWYFETLISNCTIADNVVTDPNGLGGGLYCSYDSDVNVIDSIIWGNRSGRGAQFAIGSGDLYLAMPSALTITYTDIGPSYDPDDVYDFDMLDTTTGGYPTGGAGVLIESQAINDQLASGQTAKVIVTLREPVQLRAATDWDSAQSVDTLRAEIAERQSAVLGVFSPAEFTLRYQYENQAAFSGEITAEALARLTTHPLVAHVEPARQVRKMLAQAVPLANALAARQVFDGNGVAIAIVDSGVDYTHPRLGNGAFPNAKVIGGYDTGEGDADPMPGDSAHGTACAGIAAGSLGTVGDYTGGVAYNAGIYALKIADAGGDLLTDAALAAWDWCITHRNDDPENPLLVISNSWGMSGLPFDNPADADVYSPAFTAAADTAVELGIAILAASGNDGFAGDGISWPAAMSDVISVGAVHDAVFYSDGCEEYVHPDKVTCYSNTALNLDILAPGDLTYTTDIVGAAGYTDGDYADFSGTSAACPFAAGAVASLQHAALARLGAYLAPDEIRELLVDTGDPVTDNKVYITKPRINLGAAIAALTFGPPIYIEQGCTLNNWTAPDSNSYNSWDHLLWPDSYNMQQDPNFVISYYLSQPPDQNVTSPCVDAGSELAAELDINDYTTCTYGSNDVDMVDMGYHYLIAAMPQLTCYVVDANGQVTDALHAHGYYVEPDDPIRLYPANTVVQLTAHPDYGYRVKRWTGTDDDLATDPNNTVTLIESRVVTVQFEPIPVHQLTTVVLGGNGSIIPASGVQFEGRIDLLAIPDPDYRVERWIGTDYDGSAEPNNVVTLDRDKVVVVSFELPQIIEVSGDPNAIQTAIDEAKDGDLLIVAPGVYDANINLGGKAITVTSTNPDDPNVVARTIIDCALTSRGFIFNSGEDANTIVDGFTVINGSVTGENGGGIYVDSNSAPTIRNLIIRNCSAAADEFGVGGNGGGIYVDVNTAPVFIACTVVNCTADSNGGGAYCDVNSAAAFRGCNFNQNIAGWGGGIFYHSVNLASEVNDCNLMENFALYGGGMYFDPNSSGLVIDSAFVGNDANTDGGGMYIVYANDVTVTDCNIFSNTGYRGAGIYCESALTVTISRCEIKRNKAPDIAVVDVNDPNDPNSSITGYGGGIWCWGTPALINDCVIANNVANTSGGGLYITGGAVSPYVFNCLIINNQAGRDGGGISANWHAEPFIANCTVSGNAAPGTFGYLNGNTGFGGGLYCGYGSRTTVTESIFWNNYALDGYEIAVGTGFNDLYDPLCSHLTVRYSDVKGGLADVKVDNGCPLPTWGPAAINIDPLFITGPLGDYYLSQTAAGQPQNSPCLDFGSVNASYLGLNAYTTRTDEMFDKGVVDLGYHYPLSRYAEPCRICDLIFDGIINFRDYAVFAQGWLDEACSDNNDWCGGSDLSFDTYVDYTDLAFFAACWLVQDFQPPIPNPSRWDVEPYSISITPPYTIAMSAEATYDAWGWGIQYYFKCLSDDGYTSGWQSSRTYDLTGLSLGTEMCFRVKAREVRPGRPEQEWLETRYSVGRCALVSGEDPNIDDTPPAPAPSLTAEANSPNSVVLVSTVAYDSHDVEYLFENYTLEGDPAHNSGWLSFPEGVYPTWTDTYLQPETEYCYHVRARDTSPNQNRTNWSDLACTTTPPEPDKNPPTPNPMDWDYTIMDVNGYAIDGTPHQIYLGSDYPWGHYVTMRADPTTVDP
ncbi:MAG: right-handed parallel beta-helix repeat-containing protein, partial [Planctomycetota bacterium]